MCVAMDTGLTTAILNYTLGPRRMVGAYGIICVSRGVAALLSGPLAGTLHM